MTDFLIGYVVSAVIWMMWSALFGNMTDSISQKKQFARGVFLGPIWPVVLIVIACGYIRDLWRTADWKDRLWK